MGPISFLAGAALGSSVTWAARRYLMHPQKKSTQGVADRLAWAHFVSDGVLLQKDGSLLAGLRFAGQDLESAPTEAVNRAANNIRQAIGLQGGGYCWEINVHRAEAQSYPDPETADFPTAALQQIDEERAARFMRPGGYFATENTLLITFTPPRESMRRVERVFVKGNGAGADYRRLLDKYQQAIDELQTQLASTLLVDRMDSKQLATECHRCLTGIATPIDAPMGYLDQALASGAWESSFVPKLGDDYLHIVTVTGWGESVRVAAGEFLNDVTESVRWHLRFLGYSQDAAARRIRSTQKAWFTQRKGMRAFLPSSGGESVLEDPHAVAMQENTADAMAELSSGRSRFGNMTNALIVRDTDLKRGRARATDILQRFRDAGLVAQLETMNAPAAFLGSLPGHTCYSVRRVMVSSRVFSHLFPVTAPSAGRQYNPSNLMPPKTPPLMMVEGRGRAPYRLHLHHGDVAHTLVVGATGAGKSVLVGSLMMSWLRYPKSRVVCFDVGRSHEVLTHAAGGVHINLGQEGAKALQPLRRLDTETDHLWAVSWIASLCELQKITVTPEERLGIAHAVGIVASHEVEERTLTTLKVALPERVAAAVEPYTVAGSYGRLFDGEQTEDHQEARMRTIELGEILRMGDEVIAPLLMVLFRQVERALDGAPTLIVIEEAWAALMRSDFASRMQQWLLTLRKQNAAVVIVAHTVAQIRQLRNAHIITESCPTRIMLPNAEARVPEHAEVYKFLDLGDREIDVIATAQPKSQYYLRTPESGRVVQLALDKRARAVLMPLPGMTAERSREHIIGAMDKYGDHFLELLEL